MRLIHSFLNRCVTSLLSVLQRFLVYPSQMTFSGQGSAEQLCDHVSRLGHKKVLLITDKILVDLGLAEGIRTTIEKNQGQLFIFDGVLPDPTITMVNDALAMVQQHRCDAIIAMGGGSSIDTAKGVAAAATHGGLDKLVGILKLKRKTLPLFAIPTTSGTGSEVSIAAVISDPDTHQKAVMADPKIIPQAVALDAKLLVGMPPSVTASTGIDALSHAIETYIGRWADETVYSYSGAAVKLIFEHLPIAYADGSDLGARESLSLASYYAGSALNIGSVGNVHALAHQIGGKYGIPHGVAIGAVMPHVLTASLNDAQEPLAQLADVIGVASKKDTPLQKAQSFVSALVELQARVGMPTHIDKIQTADIKGLAQDGLKEALSYPVPYFMTQAETESLLGKIRKPS